MTSQPPSTSTPPSTSAPSSPAVDVSTHRSCQRCARRMCSIKCDKHTICNQCRDVSCPIDVRSSECNSWPADVMQDYLKHHKSLVAKGIKKLASATPSFTPSLTPVVSSISSLVSQPALPSVSDDQKINEYVHSILSSFLSQTSDMSTNPSV